MLEQIAYQVPRISREEQRFYRVSDLESLSASALYDKHKLKTGQDITSDGTAYKFYTNIRPSWDFGDTELGIQENGESHDEYKKRMKKGEGINLGGGIGAPLSPIGGGY